MSVRRWRGRRWRMWWVGKMLGRMLIRLMVSQSFAAPPPLFHTVSSANFHIFIYLFFSTMPSRRLPWLSSFLLPSSDSQRGWADDNFLQGEQTHTDKLLLPPTPTTGQRKKKAQKFFFFFFSIPPFLIFNFFFFPQELITIDIIYIVYNLRSEMERKLKKITLQFPLHPLLLQPYS